MPADHEAQSQVKRKTAAKSEGTLRRPHPEERRDLAEVKSMVTPACWTDREKVIRTREVSCDTDKRGSSGSVRNAQHMKQQFPVREVRRQRET